LEKYVAAGGGLGVFLGEHTDVKFFNDVLYRGGKGLFPAPLARPAELLVDRLEPAPDLEVEGHFIFRVFAGKRNPFIQTISIERYFAVSPEWRPAADSTVRVLARLRGGEPLVVERRLGKGRVVAFLTTAAPAWNNWASNPSFVPLVLDLHAYLTDKEGEPRSSVVGAPLQVSVDPARCLPAVRFAAPEGAAVPATTITASRGADGTLTATFLDTDVAGFYEARLAHADNTVETRRFAVNVDPAEGDLQIINGRQLASRLEGVKYQYAEAATFQAAASDAAGYDFTEPILYGLILLLIGEQILAWSASYHPSRRAATEGRQTFLSAKGDAA
jgi:hypothetical protein